jgi:hypothetical protein
MDFGSIVVKSPNLPPGGMKRMLIVLFVGHRLERMCAIVVGRQSDVRFQHEKIARRYRP